MSAPIASDGAFARALHDELRADHPGLFTRIDTSDQEIGQSTASPRFNTILLSTFAAIAFLMAIVGVYGVLAFRWLSAAGKSASGWHWGPWPAAVLTLVMREGMVLVAAGALAGVGAGTGFDALPRHIALWRDGHRLLGTYAAVVIGLAVAAAIASFLPARKAALLDP